MAESPHPAWTRSRYGFAVFFLLSLLAGWFLLRLILLLAFKPAGLPLAEMAFAFLSGFHRDCFVGLLFTLPLLFWTFIIPERWLGARWHRRLFFGASFVFAFVEVFLMFVEFFFFEEFKSRFNTVAVDYLLYPPEVFGNIWEAYHVGWGLFVCLLLSLGWLFVAVRLFPRMWERPYSAKSSLAYLFAVAALAGLLAPTF